MKKTICAVLVLFFVISISGCDSKKANLEYDTIKNIYQNTPKTYKDESSQGVKFDGTVNVPDTNEIYKLSVEYGTGYYEHFEEVVEELTGSLDLDNLSVNNVSEFKEYSNEGAFVQASRGSFSWSGSIVRDVYNNPYVEKALFYHGESVSDTKYEMLDSTNFDVQSAIEQINEVLVNFTSKYDTDFEYEIRSVWIRKNMFGKYLFEFKLAKTYKGIPVESRVYGGGGTNIEHKGGVSRANANMVIFVAGSTGIETWNYNCNDSFFGVGGLLKVTSAEKLPDKFLTFEAALDIVKKNTTSVKKILLDGAELSYDFSIPGVYNRSKAFDYKYELNPVWVFTSPYPESLLGEGYKTQNERYFYILVDAVTGEFYSYYGDVLNY